MPLDCTCFDFEKFETLVVKEILLDEKNFKNWMKNSFKIQEISKLVQNQLIQHSNDVYLIKEFKKNSFKVKSILGRGAEGFVRHVEIPTLNKEFALKEIRIDSKSQSDSIEKQV
jgi:hypothetical protein